MGGWGWGVEGLICLNSFEKVHENNEKDHRKIIIIIIILLLLLLIVKNKFNINLNNTEKTSKDQAPLSSAMRLIKM